MLKDVIEKALNKQIELEASSSQFYLSMASWTETKGLSGSSTFLYQHSDEERLHMLKLVKFINERGGNALIPALIQPPKTFKSLTHVFESLLEHELNVTESINNIVGLCLEEKDFTTHNFMQWYVAEQLEEEALARTIIDRLNMIGNDKAGLYLFDRDLKFRVSSRKGSVISFMNRSFFFTYQYCVNFLFFSYGNYTFSIQRSIF